MKMIFIFRCGCLWNLALKNDVADKNKKSFRLKGLILDYSIGNLLGVPGLRGYLLGVSFVLLIT